MSRYRKIDPRIWNDEKFSSFSVMQKLAWFALLTHPAMTPLGAGVFSSQLMDSLLGYYNDQICPVCFRESGEIESSESILEGFKKGLQEGSQEGSLVLRDNHLIIVKNYLIYNRPDNPNQLNGWIESCEELPRSTIFAELRDYLEIILGGKPGWLFAGLLNPLAEQKNRDLKARFWDRIAPFADKPKGRIKKGIKKPSQEPSKRGRRGFVGPSSSSSNSNSKEIKEEKEEEKEEELSPKTDSQATAKSYKSAKGKILKGKILERFEKFLDAFGSRAGKAAAADSWVKLNPMADQLFAEIIAGAKRYNVLRASIRQKGSTPKMAQGWLTDRRWEDPAVHPTSAKTGQLINQRPISEYTGEE